MASRMLKKSQVDHFRRVEQRSDNQLYWLNFSFFFFLKKLYARLLQQNLQFVDGYQFF